MPTRFILDRKQLEGEQTLTEILELTKKKPYPTKETIHLARFIDACFYVIEDVKKKELQKKREEVQQKRAMEEQRQRKAFEEAKRKELEAMAPTPTAEPELPELPTLQELGLEDIPAPEKIPLAKREYVLQIYNTPIGILIEKEEDGSYLYKVVEPHIEKGFIQKAKDMYGKEFQRDNSLFDNQSFVKRAAEKVAKKIAIPYTDLLPQKIQYYFERDLLGAGSLDPFLYDEKVKTIISEANKNVQIEYSDLGSMPTNTLIQSEELNRFMKRLAQAAGKTLNEQNPLLDMTYQGLKCEGIMGLGSTSSRLTIKRLEK